MRARALPVGHNGSVDDMLDEFEWPSLEARREQFSLTSYKIHSGIVSLDKDKNLIPSPKKYAKIRN